MGVKLMDQYENTATAIGIALLYIIITSSFSFINKLTLFIVNLGAFKRAFSVFWQINALWILVVLAIIIILSAYSKKINLNFYTDVMGNKKICFISGVLVALEGLVNLSSLLPAYISSSRLSIQTSQLVTGSMANAPAKSIIISNVVSVVIILCQIILGIYLAKFNKERQK